MHLDTASFVPNVPPEGKISFWERPEYHPKKDFLSPLLLTAVLINRSAPTRSRPARQKGS